MDVRRFEPRTWSQPRRTLYTTEPRALSFIYITLKIYIKEACESLVMRAYYGV